MGSGGILAEEFYILVTAIWLGEFRYIVPRDFKNTVSQVAPYFAGNDQHDSQEFLVYLLDGLHEDLNKVMQYMHLYSITPLNSFIIAENHITMLHS